MKMRRTKTKCSTAPKLHGSEESARFQTDTTAALSVPQSTLRRDHWSKHQCLSHSCEAHTRLSGLNKLHNSIHIAAHSDIIIPSPYESKESHLWQREIRRGNGGFRPRNRTLIQVMDCKPAGLCATEMWKPPGPGACSLSSLAVPCLSSSRKSVRFMFLPLLLWDKPSLWRKTSCPPSVKIRKLSATSLANYKTAISTGI